MTVTQPGVRRRDWRRSPPSQTQSRWLTQLWAIVGGSIGVGLAVLRPGRAAVLRSRAVWRPAFLPAGLQPATLVTAVARRGAGGGPGRPSRSGCLLDQWTPALVDCGLATGPDSLVIRHVNIDDVIDAVDLVAVSSRCSRRSTSRPSSGTRRGSMASETVRGARMTGITVDEAISRGGPAPPLPTARRAHRWAADRMERTSCRFFRRRRAATRALPRVSPPGSPPAPSTVSSSGCRSWRRTAATSRCVWSSRPAHSRHRTPPGPALRSTFHGAVVVYLTLAWWIGGRTIGDRVMGLQVVRRRGGRLGSSGQLARAFLCVVFPIGLLWCAVDPARRSLQDLALRTSVVYNWLPRPTAT